MERERVKVATTEGDRLVEVIRRRGVWVFHRSPFFETRFCVSHVPSGAAAYEGPALVAGLVVDALGERLPAWQRDATWKSLRCFDGSPEMKDVRLVVDDAEARAPKERS